MRKLIVVLFVMFSLATPYEKAHALDAKGKAFMIICTYGTVGGALLGFASMAFGTNSRAIAQGASLGLYAGIAFGAYVVTSHRKTMDNEAEPDYNQQQPPGFGDEGLGPDGGGGFGAPPPDDNSGGFFGTPQRFIQLNEDLVYNYKLKNKKGRGLSHLPIYVPIVNIAF